MWSHLFFCCTSPFQIASNSPETQGEKWRERGPLNVQECTFAKHHTRVQTMYGRDRRTDFTELRLDYLWFFIRDGFNYVGLKQTVSQIKASSKVNSTDPHTCHERIRIQWTENTQRYFSLWRHCKFLQDKMWIFICLQALVLPTFRLCFKAHREAHKTKSVRTI